MGDLKQGKVMNEHKLLALATGGWQDAPEDWMPASQVHALVLEDPALLWLEFHGAAFGFQPDSSPYDLSGFLSQKARQFEERWLAELSPEAVRVCRDDHDVRLAVRVAETLQLMASAAPVIAQPALWWAPEKIYGAPDLIVHTSWLGEHFPHLLAQNVQLQPHYVVFDLKFTSKIEDSSKSKERQAYAVQMRLYSYMLGQMQGVMPSFACLVTRDRVMDPFPIPITAQPGEPLEEDLRALRDQFLEIKLNGARYQPWRDTIVASNLGNMDERWRSAKQTIAREKIPGGDVSQVYQIGTRTRLELIQLGYASLEALLKVDPEALPLENLKGIGASKARQIRAILHANRTGQAVVPPRELIPPQRRFEFFVDFEYFVNIDVDFDNQWPDLQGREMIFMIGVGWNHPFGGGEGSWHFQPLEAQAETLEAEVELFERFLRLLDAQTGGAHLDPAQTALYHWTSAEVWQTQRAADRQGLPADHPLLRLPWVDLQKVFLNGPAGLPGALMYGLKEFAGALGAYDPDYAIQWPQELDQGLNAMVMGWQAYRQPEPLQSVEFSHLRRYLEEDCAALERLLRWVRR
jgi:uncharacterized protein